ncbi:hypothetical protein E2562_036132 [Oryza meyeriana var. granulata]|uniref:Uncharacterized protein n=1 Tax=Oryza meyeriana var. granulata TaxID=110450 RepID=A0A6G1E779_9ORYZ|nr:hypothetical protein E2562_036132 [Oryza meyeriana var. granulata]
MPQSGGPCPGWHKVRGPLTSTGAVASSPVRGQRGEVGVAGRWPAGFAAARGVAGHGHRCVEEKPCSAVERRTVRTERMTGRGVWPRGVEEVIGAGGICGSAWGGRAWAPACGGKVVRRCGVKDGEDERAGVRGSDRQDSCCAVQGIATRGRGGRQGRRDSLGANATGEANSARRTVWLGISASTRRTVPTSLAKETNARRPAGGRPLRSTFTDEWGPMEEGYPAGASSHREVRATGAWKRVVGRGPGSRARRPA